MIEDKEFWLKLDKFVSLYSLKIDRPKGTSHPRYSSFTYPLDYGYLESTVSGDGNGIDVWIGSLQNRQVTAIICCVDLEKKDVEIKFILGSTPQELEQILQIHNTGFQSAILCMRPDNI
jgi:inorganic pyrophosphatase